MVKNAEIKVKFKFYKGRKLIKSIYKGSSREFESPFGVSQVNIGENLLSWMVYFNNRLN